jgi:hypothetical protein
MVFNVLLLYLLCCTNTQHFKGQPSHRSYKKVPRNMALEIQVLPSDMYINVAGLNQLMRSLCDMDIVSHTSMRKNVNDIKNLTP